MALPVIFSGLTAPTLPELDQNFAALGALVPIASAISGTNSLSITPAANTPTISAYVNYQPFAGIANGANTGATTAQVGSLATLNVYKDTPGGPVALAGGEIVAGNYVSLIYDSALNSGAGGFHLASYDPPAYPLGAVNALSNVAGQTLTAAQLTGNGTGVGILARAGAASGGFSDTTPAASALLTALPGAVVGTTFRFISSNGTGQTQTILGGSNVTVTGTATVAAGAARTFQGIVTSITGSGAITMYG